jgi:hypothetical protein
MPDKLVRDRILISSCPGKSAKRVFAQMCRASPSLFAPRVEDVDGRDKPGHDGNYNLKAH